jgi:hypothetical protein
MTYVKGPGGKRDSDERLNGGLLLNNIYDRDII